MLYQIKGVIDEIFDIDNVSEIFSRRAFILTAQNSPGRIEYLKFELHQKRCSYLDDGFKNGDKVIVWFQIQGNKWVKNNDMAKFYNTFKVWRIEKDYNKEDQEPPLYQIKGSLDDINSIINVSDIFCKRDFIVITQICPERFEYLKFELHQKRCKDLDLFAKGDKVIVWFQLQGNKWIKNNENKYYNSFRVWKIEKDESLQST